MRVRQIGFPSSENEKTCCETIETITDVFKSPFNLILVWKEKTKKHIVIALDLPPPAINAGSSPPGWRYDYNLEGSAKSQPLNLHLNLRLGIL